MLETKRFIEERKQEAREMDELLIRDRESFVTRNISELQGRQRSNKYVGRKAGRSSDISLTSASEFAVEWFGATAMEDPVRSQIVQEFWKPVFNYAANAPVLYRTRDFWSVDTDIAAIMSELRKAIVTADITHARFFAIQARVKLDEVLQIINEMGAFGK